MFRNGVEGKRRGQRCLANCSRFRPGGVPSGLQAFIVGSLAISICACGSGDADSPPPRLAVLSAFPAELAAVLEHATINDTTALDGHVFRMGVLGGVPVVLGVTGIGLVNATMTTRAVLEHFEVAGVVVSGVAGSPLQIGDVTVPASWQFKDGTTYAVDAEWLARADKVAVSGAVSLDRCTVVSTASSTQQVCMVQAPAVVVGGVGESTDPFGNKPFPCQPGGGDLYGCDISSPDSTVSGEDRERANGDWFGFREISSVRAEEAPSSGAVSKRPAAVDTPTGSGGASEVASADAASDMPVANDMETAAIAREAAARGVRFIAFRAGSDGAGDPLMRPPFPFEFSAYYHFAARNAAAATSAFLQQLAGD